MKVTVMLLVEPERVERDGCSGEFVSTRDGTCLVGVVVVVCSW